MAHLAAAAVIPAIPSLVNTGRNMFFTGVKLVFFILLIVGLIVLFTGNIWGGLITVLFSGIVLYAVGRFFPYERHVGGGLDSNTVMHTVGSIFEGLSSAFKSMIGFRNTSGLHHGSDDDLDYLREMVGGTESQSINNYREFIRMCQLPDVECDRESEFVQVILDNSEKIKKNYTMMNSPSKQKFMVEFNKLNDSRLNELREDFISR